MTGTNLEKINNSYLLQRCTRSGFKLCKLSATDTDIYKKPFRMAGKSLQGLEAAAQKWLAIKNAWKTKWWYSFQICRISCIWRPKSDQEVLKTIKECNEAGIKKNDNGWRYHPLSRCITNKLVYKTTTMYWLGMNLNQWAQMRTYKKIKILMCSE